MSKTSSRPDRGDILLTDYPGTMVDMKLYADSAVHRSLQVLGDLLLVVWVYLWVRTAQVVRDVTLSLRRPGELMDDAGTGLSTRLQDAGAVVEGLPFVGEEVSEPFDGAARAAQQIAAAGRSQVEAVETLAFWLAMSVGAIPVLIAVAIYLPPRWRFVREATAGRRYVDSAADLDLFALRAMARQPLHRLARISDDPAQAWRRGDPEVVRALADLELRDTGLSLREGARRT